MRTRKRQRNLKETIAVPAEERIPEEPREETDRGTGEGIAGENGNMEIGETGKGENGNAGPGEDENEIPAEKTPSPLEEKKVNKGKKPEDSIEISNTLIAAVLLIIILVAAALYLGPRLFGPGQMPERQVNQTQFDSIVLGAPRISVIMNITGASENGSRAVMQCGTDLSFSVARLGKNVSNYVFNEGSCVTPEVNTVPISECSKATKNIYETVCCFIGICAPVSECSKAMDDFYFIIGYGPDVTRYYDRHAEIEVNEQFTLGCNISRGS
ncbi:MAG: hypothetical protein NT157_06985 [Candidatus Micrarchaeota archaeon]|nr:hypothetical protein [Candidatus Micrarchaeota archaeon]